jgi:hypothetical protein
MHLLEVLEGGGESLDNCGIIRRDWIAFNDHLIVGGEHHFERSRGDCDAFRVDARHVEEGVSHGVGVHGSHY